ncbi:MAG: 3-deoxy-D-manno-octulosonic acid transferase [Rhodobacteraceae bacterium]|nr:3-deoxy-D-manno-octulosonic acid transferase [Paracoccaceae bacterium]
MPQKTSDQKSLGLSVYLGMAKYTEPLTERMKQKNTSDGAADPLRANERQGQPSLARNEGRLIWLHAENLGQSLSLLDLIGRLSSELADAQFLVTTADLVPEAVIAARLPEKTVHQYLPNDSPRAVASFMKHWRPEICLWSENKLMPVLIKEVADAQVPLIFLNAGLSAKTVKKLRWMPGVSSPVLNSFAEILAVDREAAEYFRKLGASGERVIVAGVLSEGSAALSHDEGERSRISRQLHDRPVWLAAHVHPEEQDLVLLAHKNTLRVMHRILTIISPEDSSQIDSLVSGLEKSGLNFARRSRPESLTPLTEVLLCDVPGELGLWYRIASVSFVGGSLCSAGGRNPFEPAALGSAILHGPNVENFADSYVKLAQEGAAVEVRSPDSLAEAIGEVMAPDRAAQMAHAGWQVCSEGAEVTDRVMDAVLRHLGGK